ncbi:ThuA domain-containing protein [Flavivirga abyssicola]|uniref:ThuA domain-containing protein n=1 Tax=Flavivirga abyssicola TaxID=3063533 RepID=UPI0026E0870E|nr:ThuA domain-containing protein [Flavivirga sp. MEBiC07777]WVK12665.1 ThuA domain-containing protein [Flavivirga sp. MEBiC07777]
MKKLISILILCIISFEVLACSKITTKSQLNILVFTKTAGFRHTSIPEGIKALRTLSDEQLWNMTATEDASFFNPGYLEKIDVVIFMNTTGDILNEKQEKAFENYIKKGGGFVGIHGATHTELNWNFYYDLVGAQFEKHPKIQEARLIVHQDTKHPAINMLDNEWVTTDEWYYFKEPLKSHCKVLLDIDESTIVGSPNSGSSHPIAWYHEKFNGRVFYTGLGHTNEQYSNPFFIEHLKNGVLWAGKLYDISLSNQWINLLDEDLTAWDKYIGVPHTSVDLPFDFPKSDDVTKGTPLGLNNDVLNVFSVGQNKEKENILNITGEIYGGLTTKHMYQNYHFKCEFKWGEKKWEPRLGSKRDNGILFHATGAHAGFWNVWMRSLECQVQEGDFGDFFPLSGTIAEIPVVNSPKGKGHVYNSKGVEITSSFLGKHTGGRIQRSKNMENPHGEWNTVEIYAFGDRAVFVVNGEVVSTLKNTRYETNGIEIPLKGGRLQIQSEAAECYYKSIQIKGIDAFPEHIKRITGW